MGDGWTVRPIISDVCVAMETKAVECVKSAPRDTDVCYEMPMIFSCLYVMRYADKWRRRRGVCEIAETLSFSLVSVGKVGPGE